MSKPRPKCRNFNPKKHFTLEDKVLSVVQADKYDMESGEAARRLGITKKLWWKWVREVQDYNYHRLLRGLEMKKAF